MLSIAERVAAGAAWLDEHRPGWVERVNPDTLDLGDTCHCVLGQEYSDYWSAPNEVIDDDGRNGFNRQLDDSAGPRPMSGWSPPTGAEPRCGTSPGHRPPTSTTASSGGSDDRTDHPRHR